MATLDELCEANALVKIGGGLDQDELPERRLYAFPHVIDWIENELEKVESVFAKDGQTPAEQLDDLFHLFVSGADLSFFERSHSMQPVDPGMWELKTPDLRAFGWFRRRSTFVVSRIASAASCKQHNLYHGYLGDGVRLRDRLDLDEPKFVTGGYDDVL